MILELLISTLFPYTTLFRSLQAAYANLHTDQERDYFMQRYHDVISSFGGNAARSEERFSRNAETDLVCRLLLEKKTKRTRTIRINQNCITRQKTNTIYGSIQ